MPKPTKGPRIGGTPAHERIILANLASQLFEHGRITTTESKAKALRPYAEKLVTHAKAGTLAHRREVLKVIRNKDVVHTLFAEIGPFYADRNGGYTRIIKTLPRKGDNAPMAVIELVRESTASSEASRATRVAASKKAAEDKLDATEEVVADTDSADGADNVVEAVEADATDAEVANAEAVAEAVDDESTAATAPDAEAAGAAVDGDKK